MFANFFKYALFILRRERFIVPIWILAISGFSLALALAYPNLFPDQQSMEGMALVLSSPPMVGMMGPVYGLDQLTPAMMMAQQCLLWFGLATIIMNIFFVVRHTRTDEELGRNEMLASLPVGRLTNAAAVIVIAFLYNLLISLLIGLSAIVADMEGATAAGALTYGFSIGMQGFAFAGITLLMAQIFSTASAAKGFPFAILGIAYIFRAVGDMDDAVNQTTNNPLSFISPLGLGLKVQAFYHDYLYPIVALFAIAAVFAIVALALNAIRDIGAGIVPARKGRAHASAFLRSPLGFAWRMSRGSFIIWALAVFSLAASYGSVVGRDLTAITEGNPMLEMVFGNTDMFVTMISGIMCMVACIPMINCVNHFRAEEKRNRLEQVFACSVSRESLLGSFLFIALLQMIVFPLLGVLGLYSTSSHTTNLEGLMEASFVYLPALLFMIGLTTALVGWLPGFSKWIWSLFGYAFFIFYFGRIFTNLPEFLPKLSPFGNVPQLPVEEFRATPLVVMTILGIALIVAGFVGIRQRDIKG